MSRPDPILRAIETLAALSVIGEPVLGTSVCPDCDTTVRGIVSHGTVSPENGARLVLRCPDCGHEWSNGPEVPR